MIYAKLEVMKKKILIFVTLALLLSIYPRPILAQIIGGQPGGYSGGSGRLCGVTGTTVSTGLGNIPTEPDNLVKWILCNAIAIGGGLAVLLSLFGGATIILAGGNPEKINEGGEIITSAISGILFIVFSVFLLRFIGVDILQIFP